MMKPKMEESFRDTAETSSRGVEIERAKLRCRAVIDRLLSTLPPYSSDSHSCCNRTLLRLAQSELSFLSRFPDPNPVPNSFSSNIGHLEAVVYILQQPFIKGVSRVCKPVSLSPLGFLKYGKSSTTTITTITKSVHVDIVCTLNGNPVWWIVSARNPKFVSWNGSCQNKSLRTRIVQVLDAAAHSFPSTKPCSIILFFSHGLDESIRKKLEHEFGASELGIEFPVSDFGFSEELEGEWIYIHQRSFAVACVLEIKVEQSKNVVPKIECGFNDPFPSAVTTREDLQEECIALNLCGSLCSLMSRMKQHPLDLKDVEFAREKGSSGEAMVNFDTTALVALISGISNGCTEKILSKSERELRLRFKSNYEFVIAQVITEIQNPIHVELDAVLSGKRGMICELVCSEFKKIVSMCGGPNEKSRAVYILKCLIIVPDSPSARMMSLPNTRKLAFKNKVCFGTGDHWRAPTLTANMGFVRAISQTGMSLFTLEHMPRALTGD